MSPKVVAGKYVAKNCGEACTEWKIELEIIILSSNLSNKPSP
jgi:hypothetical protein